jgi:hypothetical protein
MVTKTIGRFTNNCFFHATNRYGHITLPSHNNTTRNFWRDIILVVFSIG